MNSPDTILSACQEQMTKAIEYLKKELRGVRTGRASPSIVENLKVEYYGSQTDMKNMAAISCPEPTQILIKPFDASSVGDIKKAIEQSGLGFNPIVESKQVRISIPALSGDRRKQLVAHCKKITEEAKVTIRNARRDANKHADALKTDPKAHVPEDEIETLKKEIQDLLKKFETEADDLTAKKVKEVETV